MNFALWHVHLNIPTLTLNASPEQSLPAVRQCEGRLRRGRSLRSRAPVLAKLFLENFLDQYPPESLYIAGPLVPFFKSLCACDTPYPEFGPVCPTIGQTPGILEDEHPCLPLIKRIFLPNTVGIRNGILNTQRALVNNQPVAWDFSLHDPTAAQAQPIGHQAAEHLVRDARIMPGTIRPLTVDIGARKKYATYDGHFIVPGAPAAADRTSWGSFLGLQEDASWFGTLAAQMQYHTTSFKGSTTLLSCPPKAITACLVKVTHEAEYANANAHRANATRTINLVGSASALCSNHPEAPVRLGMLTQLYWIPAPNFAPGLTEEQLNATRAGPYWNIAPTRSRSGSYNPQTRIPTIIMEHFFSEKGEI